VVEVVAAAVVNGVRGTRQQAVVKVRAVEASRRAAVRDPKMNGPLAAKPESQVSLKEVVNSEFEMAFGMPLVARKTYSARQRSDERGCEMLIALIANRLIS
jgi:hypothetical protein